MATNQLAQLPGFVRGRLPWFLLWLFGLIAVTFFATLVAPMAGFPLWFRIAGWIIYAITLPVLIGWFVTPMPRALARVRRGELPCWHCGYDVRHCTKPRCPECDHELNAQELQARWDEAITRAARKRR
jgi:uncharacterized paraquat-inducible protein A